MHGVKSGTLSAGLMGLVFAVRIGEITLARAKRQYGPFSRCRAKPNVSTSYATGLVGYENAQRAAAAVY